MNFVARRCTFSTKARCFAVYGDHKLEQYSNSGLTNEQYNNLLVLPSWASGQILLTRPSVLFAFAVICSMWLVHCSRQETVTPRSLMLETYSILSAVRPGYRGMLECVTSFWI